MKLAQNLAQNVKVGTSEKGIPAFPSACNSIERHLAFNP
jgi:hypothetical protein